MVAPPKARVVRRAPPKRQVALRRATPAPPKPGFPHTASLVTLGIGLALVGAGVGVGVVSLEANRQSDTLAQQGPKAHAGKLQEAYQHAQTMAWVHTGLWIASGLTLAAAGGLFLYERSRKPKSPASPVASGALTSPTGARQGQGTHLFELSL